MSQRPKSRLTDEECTELAELDRIAKEYDYDEYIKELEDAKRAMEIHDDRVRKSFSYKVRHAKKVLKNWLGHFRYYRI